MIYNVSNWKNVEPKGLEKIGESGGKICRKKELRDFSCAELLKPLALGWKDTRIKNDGLIWSSTLKRDYTPKDIYDMFIDKRCMSSKS